MSGLWRSLGALAMATPATPEAGINWWAWDAHRPPMGWFIGDFAVFVALLAVLGLGPLRQVLAERHQHIKRSIAEAAVAHADAVRAQKESRDRLAGVHDEAQAWLEESRREGERERARLVAQAEARAAASEADVATMVTQEGRRAEERLRAALARATVARARDQLAGALDTELQARLNDAAIARLDRDLARAPRGRPT